MNTIQDVLFAMIQYDSGDPARIQHFLKVHAFARIIGLAEGLDTASLFILEAAAIIHDIGIQNALKTYGRCDGPLQEKLGPPEAEKLLRACGLTEPAIQRASWLCAHHHTYRPIEGLDHQILIEADFLVNLFEENESKKAILSVYHKIFRTKTGKELCKMIFDLAEEADSANSV